jgi:pilus assembly protein CpaF
MEVSENKFIWHHRIHKRLMEVMDLRRVDIDSLNEKELATKVEGLIHDIIEKMDHELPADIDRKMIATEVLNEAVALGPLEAFLADEKITEIMVNRYDDIYYESGGKLKRSAVTFSSNEAVLAVIDRIVSPLGRRIDESSPMVDGRLKDGSRINAIIPPLATKGPCLTIRKFSKRKLTSDDLVQFGAVSEEMMGFLEVAVLNRKNIIVSGGTGSGKTTFLNVLSNYIPHNERIITVEDSAELQLSQPHTVTLEARPANMEGKGVVSIRDLVKNCLRMRPDRIIVGECRGGETLDMLQAMNTGHDGSLTTVHANSPRDLISRLEVMTMMAGMDLPERAIREQVASAVHMVVQQSRFSDGTRKVTHISEITGLESGVVQMQHIFIYKQNGLDEDGMVVGDFQATGRVPEFYEDLRQRGLKVDMKIFG